MRLRLVPLVGGIHQCERAADDGLSPVQSFAPTNLTIRVHVEPDAGKLAFEVVAESGEYYRSSRIQLDGADAPHVISLEIRNLPNGDDDRDSRDRLRAYGQPVAMSMNCRPRET